MPPQPNTKQPNRKTLIQPRITDFLTRKSVTKCTGQPLTLPTFNYTQPENANIFGEANLSPTYNTTAKHVYLTPIIDMNKVVKDRDFYSMTEFKEDEKKLVAVKKSLFDNSKSGDNNNLKRVNVVENTMSRNLIAGKKRDVDSKNKRDVCNNVDQLSTKDIADVVDVSVPQIILAVDLLTGTSTKQSSTKTKKPHKTKKPPTNKLDQVKVVAEGEPQLPDLTTTIEPQPVVRSKREPNEIQVASLVFPVLLREPSATDLRKELNSLGIVKPFSFQINGFQERLERIGLEESEIFVQKSEMDIKSVNLKCCLYCGFVTESSLVLGRHLDLSHKNKFKKWPFSSRMDFNKFQ